MYKQERNFKEVVGENIFRLMTDRGWSTHELGRMIGVSGSAVNYWCRGINMPAPEMLTLYVVRST